MEPTSDTAKMAKNLGVHRPWAQKNPTTIILLKEYSHEKTPNFVP